MPTLTTSNTIKSDAPPYQGRHRNRDAQWVPTVPVPTTCPGFPPSQIYDWRECRCPQGGWYSISPPPPCPIHGSYRMVTVTCANGPSMSDLIYAATARCPCGHGLAYKADADPFKGFWDCSAIFLGTADVKVQHTAQLPFVFYEIKSEKQPSAQGATTRPAPTV